MRVTATTFPSVLSQQLTRLSTQQARLQTQAGTGQRFRQASEDPRAMRKVLDLQTEIKSLGQYQNNVGTLKDSLDASYAAVSGLKKVSDRATEIATSAGGLRTPAEMQTYATEVDQLLERALQLANSRHQSSFLFGGTKNTVPPYEVTRGANGRITGVAYVGTGNAVENDIAEGISISINVPGSNSGVTGPRGLFKDGTSGADFFQHLIDLRTSLDAADAGAVRDTNFPNLLKDENNILFHIGNIGAVQSRLDIAGELANRRSASLEGLVSKESDADLAETLVSLSEIQNAYTAALKSGGTILSQSLLDFIR